MLKPMGKKTSILPSPQTCLEEWSQRQASALQTNAASRIQLRYRRYREKVRAYMQQRQKQPRQVDDSVNLEELEADSVATATSSAKAALRERGVAGSSMALAMALNVRKDQEGAHTSNAVLGAHVLAHSKSSGECDRHGSVARAEPPRQRSWKEKAYEWETKSPPQPVVTAAVASSDSASEEEKGRGVETKGPLGGNDHASAPLFDEEEKKTESVESAKRHGFVNVMEPSWLVASMEERCAHAAASLGAKDAHGNSSLQLLDIRRTVLDLLFISRSGHGYNVHGRHPSSSSVHRRNLVKRVASDGTEVASEQLSHDEMRRIDRIFRSLRSEMFLPAVRCLGWILTKTWRMLFHGLHLDVESLERVRRTLEATDGNVSIVFAPTHKTHLDYLIISYICFAYGIPLPRIAAGNNLDLPLLGSFLRSNGSFFIRRSFRDDLLYKKVLHHYVHELLNDGNPIEVFVEGGRSRHGRVCKPRLGFLSMFADYAHRSDDDTKDVLLIPISLDYDRVFEVEEYANQLLGKPKQKESLRGFFSSVWDLLFLRFGHSYVRFGAPVSIKAHRSIDEVATALSCRLQKCGTITSTAVTSAVMMWKRHDLIKSMLHCRVTWLLSELEQRGATVAHLDNEDLVEHALTVLRIQTDQNELVDAQLEYPTKALELGFYRNHLLHVFLPEMAAALAIQSFVVDCKTSVIAVSLSDVLKKAATAWQFLLHICRHESVTLCGVVRKLMKKVAWGTMVGTDIVIDMNQWNCCRTTSFLLSLSWPFVDSLWVSLMSCQSVPAHVGTDEISELLLIRRAQVLAKEMYLSKTLVHAEALCSESIRQCFEFLVEANIVSSTTAPNGKGKVIKWAIRDDLSSRMEELIDTVRNMRKPLRSIWKAGLMLAPSISESSAIQIMLRTTTEATVYDTWMSH